MKKVKIKDDNTKWKLQKEWGWKDIRGWGKTDKNERQEGVKEKGEKSSKREIEGMYREWTTKKGKMRGKKNGRKKA